MGISHFLDVSDLDFETIESALKNRSIAYTRSSDFITPDGQHRVISLQLTNESGAVNLNYEKRVGKMDACITIVPMRRFVFLKNSYSIELANRASQLLCELGAEE